MPREVPQVSPEQARVNREAFDEFCRLKLGVRGPDVHMKTAGEGVDLPPGSVEQLWWFGVYTALCSTPPAAAIYGQWSLERTLSDGVDALESWVRENWPGIPVRKNRRPVRAPAKLARCIYTYATWLDENAGRLYSMSYPQAWRSVDDGVTFFGRYAIIKLLEVFRRYGGRGLAHLDAIDIHPADGWSPRKALALMYPDQGWTLVRGGNSTGALAEVNALAADARDRVADYVGHQVSLYEIEALLCNFRQTLSGTFYVGRTIDSELSYYEKSLAHFGEDPFRGMFDFFRARRDVFPPETLGELNGWDGPRKPLFDGYNVHGYFWADTVYDYNATVDFANPVRRGA